MTSMTFCICWFCLRIKECLATPFCIVGSHPFSTMWPANVCPPSSHLKILSRSAKYFSLALLKFVNFSYIIPLITLKIFDYYSFHVSYTTENMKIS